MAVKLILTDIDGTILPYGHMRVSERTVAAIHAALDAGIVAGPASGRFHSWIPAFFGGDEACCATAIAANGMQVYHAGEMVLERMIDPDALRRAAAVLRAAGAEERANALCRAFDRLKKSGVPLDISELAVGGNELLAAGIPARQVGGVLNKLLADCADGGLKNEKEQLIRRAVQYRT